jgi:hypothetical protein
VRVPLALTLLSSFGCLLAFHRGTPRLDRIAAAVLLALASVLLIVLMLSNADYAGVRHALTVYFVMAVLCGFAMRFLLRSQRKAIGVAVFALVLGACTPALIVERPWEYHNFLAGGTGRAYRYFRNDGIDLGQRDKEIAEYCRQKLEPAGEVPYVGYYPSLIKPDLVSYRHVRLKALDNPSGGEIPPATISGTLLVHASGAAPAIWSDHKALREAQPVGRMGNVLVYRGTFYLPNIRADALFDRAAMLLEQPNPDFPRIESLLKEGLVLRSNDFSGWMMLGNLHLIRREREEARSLRQGPRQYSAQPISYALRRTDREGLEPTCGLG